ncbi:protein MIS12 homolog [Amaranthus tricolor]|uniref:protein MIS12 homolog n=1 Tax=Amaranthus tricolor TaxID=29722 RepID=UPI00258EFFA4|nr:protein MIS12 homolog [Amaranthus tricolor]
MEDSESMAVFKSLNFEPQLFINETLNLVDDVVDDAFRYFHLEASKLLKIDGTDRSQDLRKGIDYIHGTIQASLDKRLSLWEKYCLRHCFTVPTGFCLPSQDEASGDDSMNQDDLNDERIRVQLELLRNKLAKAGKEHAELKQELQNLEGKISTSNQHIPSVNEAIQLYDQCSAHDMFQEMLRVGSELRQKMEQLKSKQMADVEQNRRERPYNAKDDISDLNFRSGLSEFRLDELQEFMA